MLPRRRDRKARTGTSGGRARRAGFACAGARFYAWDDDKKALASWISELASADQPEPRTRTTRSPYLTGRKSHVMVDLAPAGDEELAFDDERRADDPHRL